jgi:hypothetical protein
MANFIRYALATFCLAASVGCLALWLSNDTYLETVVGFGSAKIIVHIFDDRFCVIALVRTKWFALWYPALIFALAGVAAVRLDRRFTLRSALIATTVLAALLGMAVSL